MNAPKQKCYCIFRLDDYVFGSDRGVLVQILQLIRKYRVPHTIGFIPQTLDNRQDLPEFAFLRQSIDEGWIEPALHGWDHQKRQLPDGSKSEFAGLSFEKQTVMLREGKRIVEDVFQREVYTFIPPFNTYDGNTVRACADCGIALLSASLSGLHNPGVMFLPQTTNLQRFARAWDGSDRRFVRSPAGSVQVVVYHPFEFRAMPRSKRKCTLPMLERVLRMVAEWRSVEVVTLGQAAAALKGELSAERLEAARKWRETVAGQSRSRRGRLCLDGCPSDRFLYPVQQYQQWHVLVNT